MADALLIEQMQGAFLVIAILCVFGIILCMLVTDKHQCHHRDCPHRPPPPRPLPPETE